MALALLIARLVLAAVFAVAGLAKLADRAGSRQALSAFGLPAAQAGLGGTLLPLAELGVAVALIPVATAWWGALGALTLLLLFVLGISYNLAQGRTPDCHCFGQLHAAPAGWPTLLRNGLLVAVAGFIVWQGQHLPGLRLVGWLGTLPGSQVVSLAAALLLVGLLVGEGGLLLNLLRQNGRLLLRIEALEAQRRTAEAGGVAAQPVTGLSVGLLAPGFQLATLAGIPLTLDALRAQGKPVMLVFSDPGCGPCSALLPVLARWQNEHAAQLTVALISRGTAEANRAKAAEHGLTYVLLQQDREVAQAYQVQGTPTAVIIHADGTIGSPLAPGSDAIAALVARTVATPAPVPHANGHGAVPTQPVVPPIGAPAPALTLPDLAGKSNLSGLGVPPENFLVRAHVPQLAVLQHSSVFLTHDGMNSVMEGLYYGVPLVVIPQMLEQRVTAKRVEALGLGIALESNAITVDLLQEAITRVASEPEFRTRVQHMRESIRESGGCRSAADAIIQFTRTTGQRRWSWPPRIGHPA